MTVSRKLELTIWDVVSKQETNKYNSTDHSLALALEDFIGPVANKLPLFPSNYHLSNLYHKYYYGK
jgi:hypothetical protein